MRRGMTVVAALALLGIVPAAEAAKPVQIKVLSGRADLVSGGDALVQVKPRGATVFVGRRNVTRRFAIRPDGRYLALLTGLRNGKNVVTAYKRGRGARLVIRNHPIGGPVTAGPQIKPWTCFEDALDKQCNRKPERTYYYKPSDGGSFQEYDPENPPEDVATTTTDSGEDGAVHRARGDRRARPRRVPDRRAVRPVQADRRVDAAEGPERPARDLPRRQLRHGVRAGSTRPT